MGDTKPPIAYFVLAALAAALLFAWIAWAVASQVPALDLSIRAAVHAAASPALTWAMLFMTSLGSGIFLWPCGVAVCAALETRGRRSEAIWFAVAVLGANLANEAMKLVFHRARPDAFFGYAKPATYSFPSGHALVSFCFYAALAQVLMKARWPMRRKAAVWGAVLLVCAGIGLSRVYLGVHYASDVAGGYAGAVVWMSAVACLRRRT